MKSTQNGLDQLIKQRQIVQHYPPPSHPSHHYPTLYHHQSPYFYEDEVFQELEKTAIVEDYLPPLSITEENTLMDVQEPDLRMEQQEPYMDFFPQEKPNFQRNTMNMLDSDSSGRQLPSRKSSVSSIESQTQNSVFSPLLMRPQVADLKAESFIKGAKMMEERKPRVRKQIGSSTEKRERMQKIKKVQEIGCNCRKSKCLKMYCECFNLQILCGQNCNCVDCGNMSETEHHQKAVLDALTRNPKAFAEDAQVMPTVFQLGLDLNEVKKGCKCRKTKCLKKYCECFNSGQVCGIFCQCTGCCNTPAPPSPR